MEKFLGQDFKTKVEREMFLKDNCDACENKGYMKPYTSEELQGHKEKLANVSIEISEIEAELKQVQAEFKGKLKPLRESRAMMVSNIRAKAEYVTEPCYKFIDQEARMTGYYNADGELIECRPATADEMQLTIFHEMKNVKKTGTND